MSKNKNHTKKPLQIVYKVQTDTVYYIKQLKQET